MRTELIRRSAFVVALAASAHAARAFDMPSERTRWLTLRTAHFVVVSDARESRVHEVTLQLERMVAALGKVAPQFVRSSLPTDVFAFASESSFEDYCTAVFGRPCNGVAGLFVPGKHANYLLISASHFDEAREIAGHELTHSFVRNIAPEIPLWLNEGLAEFYGSFTVTGKDVRIGVPEVNHLETLQRQGWLPIARVLAVGYDSPEYTQESKRPVFYAESWLLTHYLLAAAPEGRRRLGDYLTRVERGQDCEAAFRAAFGVATEEFRKALYGYTQQGRMPALRIANADLAVPDPGEARELPRDEALAELATPILDGERGSADDARRLLEEARRSKPDSPLADALLAWALARAGNAEQADAMFNAAVHAPSREALPALLYAEHLLDRSRGITANDIARARELLTNALGAEPDSVPALVAVGTSYLVAPGDDPAPGIRALEKALAIEPSRPDAASSLAQLLARSGQDARAKDTVKRFLLTSPDARTRAQGLEVLAHVEANAANAAARQGRYDEAAAAFEAAAATTKDPSLQAQIRSQLKSLRDLRDYNAAVDLANRGDRAGAVAALDRLIPIVQDPALRSSATSLRDTLAAGGQPSPAPATADARAFQASRHALEDREEALRREAAAQKEAERYNQAVALANRGELRDALVTVEDLAANATNATVRTAAAGLRDRLRARLAGAR